MTKEQYFEMCEMLGTEPVESEIPIEFDDLFDEVQEAIQVYNMLQDNWDTMNGNYMGKHYAGIADILSIAEVEDRRTCFKIIQLLDSERISIVNNKKQKPAK
jgi:hypothetical protein